MRICRTCKLEKEESEFDKRKRGEKSFLQSDCKYCICLARHARYMAAKELVFIALGDRCCHCGFKDKRALQIDHINGDGGEMRRNGHTMTSISDLKYAANHPEKFQILCANCNWIKRAKNKEGNKWNFWELPILDQAASLKIASTFAVKNITGFITDDRRLQQDAENVGLLTIPGNLRKRAEDLKKALINSKPPFGTQVNSQTKANLISNLN